MASKDGSKIPSEIDKEDIETITSQRIEYLLRKRAEKAKDISKKGSSTVLRTVKERVFQTLQDASKTTQDVIALQSDDATKRAESEGMVRHCGARSI